MSIRTTRTRTNKLTAALLASLAVTLAACGGNDAILRSGKGSNTTSSPAAPAKSAFEEDIEAMRTAKFSFIYVLRRKDGGVIDGEDKSVIRTQTAQVNRRVSSDDGKAVIVGSNTELPGPNMGALNQRFAVENYSPAPQSPVTPLPANDQNSNR